jgi:NitT/TauT family transport system permease protein
MQQGTIGRARYGSWQAPRGPEGQGRALGRLALPLSLALALALWELLVTLRDYPAFILPTPTAIWQRFVAAAAEGTIWVHAGVTVAEALGGFGLALAAALVLGYTLAKLRWLERVLAPHLAASQAVPVVAVAPLIILWVGAGIWAKILVAALITFFPMLIATIVALRSVPQELREMALISGANGWQLLRYVELPLALPVLFGGIKTGLALATTGAVVGEFVAGRDGLGALINIARGLFDTPLMFVALALLVAITLGLYLLATLAERLLTNDQ